MICPSFLNQFLNINVTKLSKDDSQIGTVLQNTILLLIFGYDDIFNFNLDHLMLRRLAAWIPKRTILNSSFFRFSENKPQPQKQDSRHQRQRISSAFQRKIIEYYSRMIKEAKAIRQQKSTSPLQKILGINSKKSSAGEHDPQAQRQAKIQGNIGLFALILAAALIYFNDNSRHSDSIASRASRIVNESQMIGLLSSGNYHPDLIILRQVVHAGHQDIYQTICVAKEINKTDYPVTCVITNLAAFLINLEKINHPYKVSFNYSAQSVPQRSSINIGNIILISLLGYLFYKYKTGSFNFGNNGLSDIINTKKFQPIKPENIKTYFKDVAGMHQAKQEITQFVDFLKNPDRYIEMGAKIPKGALLTGPPGTGKTLLARACAGEAGVPFFYVSGSQFVEKYVGMGANRVRSLFESAAKAAPSIIFIDQIDAIGKKRNSGPFANQQKENTLNQLLVNMDGFDTKHKIIVMAATNIKDSLDPALLRPGRFDRSVQIGLPNFEQRIQILQVHLQKIKFNTKFTIQQLAKKISVLTPGFSGAQLANICNEAAILAARANKSEIDLPEFQKATERVMAGLQKRNLFSEQEKQCLAYYECGKAVAAWFTEGADPVIKVSITPYSKSSSGYSHEIKNEMPLKTQEQLINRIICALAGRTSENLFKGFVTSNGDEDLKKAKRIITYLVTKFGMSKMGKIGFPDVQYVRKPYSEQTQKKIDQQIERIYKECQQKAETLISSKKEQIQKLKQQIILKQTLSHNTLKQILGDRPFSNHENYQKFLQDAKKAEEPIAIAPDSVQPQ